MIKRFRPMGFILLGIILGLTLASIRSVDKRGEKAKPVKKILYWVAPMDPNYRRDKPGKSPMGMDLVPVYEKAIASETPPEDAIHIDPQVIDNLGVISKPAIIKTLTREINTIGYVQADENSIESINVYTDGWIKDLNVNAVGDKVKKGQVLFTLYSPSLVLAEEEYLLAIQNNNHSLMRAGQKKLETLGLNTHQIAMLRQSKKVIPSVRIFAETDGIISALNIREGMYVTANTKLMVIENLATIWVKVSILEKMANWVVPQLDAVATFSGLPGQSFKGKVRYVYPTLDKKTHTLSASLIFENPGLMLKPNMYADVSISVPAAKPNLTIPESAVIFLGEGAHVIKDLGKGYFKAVPVVVGSEAKGERVILSGLNENDKVVTYSQFLIDSESSLNGAFKRLSPIPKEKKVHHHPHHQMKEHKMHHQHMGHDRHSRGGK